MSQPLLQLFTGPEKRTNTEALLHGKLPIPGGLAYPTEAFLRHCRLHKDFAAPDLFSTVADHVTFWSKNPEKKGSEPNGLHNGHFKAGATSDLLAECDAAFRAFPLSTGFVLAQ